MEKILKLYTYIDGVNDTPFPNESEQAELYSFTYDAKRMGDAPTITFSLMHPACLDNVWTEQVYVEFNGEKYFLHQVPSSSYSNTDSRYKHDGTFVSERVILNDVYFFDVVTKDTENDKPVSNSSNVVFFGDIEEFVGRLNYSLAYSHLDYNVVIDGGVTSEAKLMSFNNQFFSNVLQEIYNTYELPYYFEGKTIHIGERSTEIPTVFEYGVDNALLSVQKSNANYRIVNRCTGIGGEENIPYYYPNPSPYGEVEYFYNGASTTNVNVVDWLKFAKCGLAGSLEYISGENVTQVSKTICDDISDVKLHGYDMVTSLLTEASWNWIGKVSFKLDSPQNVLHASFSSDLEPRNPSYVNESYHVARSSTFWIEDNNGVEIFRASDASTPDEGLRLTYGTYTMFMSVAVGWYFRAGGTKEEAEREFHELHPHVHEDVLSASKIFVKVVSDLYTTTNFWSLNGEGSYTLGALGLQYVGTPTLGDTITFGLKKARIPVVANLMPPRYRETEGAERFYNALNDTYLIPDGGGEYYTFPNPYVVGKPKEYILEVDDIKPSIEGMTNSRNERIDVFSEFAFDLNDNDEIGDDDNLIHPHFFAKLRKFDGDNGFNLFAHAIEGNPMTIAMTSGPCGACQWRIKVDEKTQLNTVQVYEEDTVDDNGVSHKKGELKRNSNGDVMLGSAQDIQNDTTTNEVWIALEKEDSTFGVLMPNAANNYKPNPLDTFVILHISLPQSYIDAAEKRLEDEIIKYMSQNNSEKFNFSIKFSRIYLAENPHILEVLTENVSVKIKYNGHVYNLYVSSYSYKSNSNDALPEITVQLSDTLTVNRSITQNIVQQVKKEVSGDVQTAQEAVIRNANLLSSNSNSNITGRFSFGNDVEYGGNLSSFGFFGDSTWGNGWAIYKDPNGDWVFEADKVIVRDDFVVNTIVSNHTEAKGGREILSAAAMECNAVYEVDNGYACYFDPKGGSISNLFVEGDIVLSQKFDAENVEERFYKRQVLEVGATHIVVDNVASNGDIPSVGDVIIQYGHISDRSRQYIIVRDVVDGGYERMISGLTSVSSEGKEYYFAGRKSGESPRWFVGDSNDQHIEYKDGKLNIVADVQFGPGSSGLTDIPEFGDLIERMDDVEETTAAEYVIWFVEQGAPEDYAPTLDNYPAVDWTTEEMIADHEWDIFYNRYLGRAWRFLSGNWTEITDADTIAALTQATEARERADALQYLKDALGTDDMTTDISNGLVMAGFVGVKDAKGNLVAAMMNATQGQGDDNKPLPYFAAGISDPTDIYETSKLKIDLDGQIEQRDTSVTDKSKQRRLRMSVGEIAFAFGDNEPEVVLAPDKYTATPSDVMMFSELAVTGSSNISVLLPSTVIILDVGGATTTRLVSSVQIGKSCTSISVGGGTLKNSSTMYSYEVYPRLITEDNVVLASGTKRTLGHTTIGTLPSSAIIDDLTFLDSNGLSFNKKVRYELVITGVKTGEANEGDAIVTPTYGLIAEYDSYLTVLDNVTRSAYDNRFFGNGLFFAKSENQYFGLLADDTNGAVMELRNGDQGLRMYSDGFKKWHKDFGWIPSDGVIFRGTVTISDNSFSGTPSITNNYSSFSTKASVAINSSKNRFVLTLPSGVGLTTTNRVLTLVGMHAGADTTPIYASITASTANTFTIFTGGDGSPKSGSFYFEVKAI